MFVTSRHLPRYFPKRQFKNKLSIESFPIDVLKEIFSWLKTQDVQKCYQVCKKWKWVVTFLYIYKVGNTIEIHDKTFGRVTIALFDENQASQMPAYKVSFNNKTLTYPAQIIPSELPLLFTECNTLSFEGEGKFIKITEKKITHVRFYYIDPAKPRQVGHNVYQYQPKEIKFEEVLSKLESLKEDHPNLRKGIALYNQHGVAVVGFEDQFTLYWANPYEEKIKKIDASECMISNDDRFAMASSQDKQVRFQYKFPVAIFLNGVAAQPIHLSCLHMYKFANKMNHKQFIYKNSN